MSEREDNFERMLAHVTKEYADTCEKLERLRAEGKTKTATYRQLISRKLEYGDILSLYKLFGLSD